MYNVNCMFLFWHFDIFCIHAHKFVYASKRPYENTSVMFIDNPHHHVQNKFWANDVDNIHKFLANIKKN